MGNVGWDFYIIVGGSLFIAFLMAYLGWRQEKNEKKGEAAAG